MADLLPCPFCGGKAHHESAPFAGLKGRVHCSDSYCDGSIREDLWNRRVPWLPPEDVETLRQIEFSFHGNTMEYDSYMALGTKLAAILARLEGVK